MDDRRTGHGTGDGFAGAVETALDLLAAELDYGLWVLSRREDDRYVVLGIRDRFYGLDAGVTVPWADTICSRLVLGNGPPLAPDVSLVPAYAAAPITELGQVGAYVGQPIALDDGTVFGTLCGIHPERRAEDPAELAKVRALAELLGRVLSAELRLDETARRAERAEHEAGGDPLTGVGNRRTWDRAMGAEEARCRRYGHTSAVVAVDLDGLKQVNDLRGHAAGDALLRRCARVLASQARGYDVVARVGGDEFCMLLPSSSADVATKARDSLENALAAAGVPSTVGVGVRRPGSSTLSEAWAAADADLYRRRAFRRAQALTGQTEGVVSDQVPAGLATPAPTPLATPSPTPLEAAISTGLDAELRFVPEDLGTGPEDRIRRLLDQARAHLAADVAFVGEVHDVSGVGLARTLRYVSAVPELAAQIAGRMDPIAETMCRLVLRGHDHAVVRDARRDPRMAEVPNVVEFGIRGHVGVPLVLPDGTAYGTLCCVLFQPDESLNERDASVLRVIAGVVADELHRDLAASTERRGRLAALDAIIERGGPQLVLQPIVDLATGVPVGYEALSRFPTEPWLGPERWFAEAAEAGLDADLQVLVLRRARALLARLPAEHYLTVNLSPAALCAPALQRELLAGPVDRLVIELTEQADAGPHGVEDALRVVRVNGLRVAIDDAGAGFSSLSRLLALRPDIVKLDLGIVRGIVGDPARQALVSSLVAFTGRMGAALVAEGIEHEVEVEVLAGLGVTHGQGYHLGRPVSSADFLLTANPPLAAAPVP